jgi:hypothetical protein
LNPLLSLRKKGGGETVKYFAQKYKIITYPEKFKKRRNNGTYNNIEHQHRGFGWELVIKIHKFTNR